MSGKESEGGCRTPSQGGAARDVTVPAASSVPVGGVRAEGMARLPDCAYRMRAEDEGVVPVDGEGPVHPVRFDAFLIFRHAVSDAEFRAFTEATGYGTDAERYGWSFVFAGLLSDGFPGTRGVAEAPCRRYRVSARSCNGPDSSTGNRGFRCALDAPRAGAR